MASPSRPARRAIYAQSGGTLTIDGNVNVSANGYGGDSSLTGECRPATGPADRYKSRPRPTARCSSAAIYS